MALGDTQSEAKAVHDQLCACLEAGDARLLGKDNENLPRIMVVVATILGIGTSVVSEQSTNKLMAILGKLVRSLPQEIVQQQVAQMDPKTQQVIQAAMAANGA